VAAEKRGCEHRGEKRQARDRDDDPVERVDARRTNGSHG
jgi:hypothetical protein